MSTNGNQWFHSYWRGAARVNPTKPGWYAARPECCNTTVKVFIYPNLLDVFVEGQQELKYDVYDFEWWHELKSEHDKLPEFRT